MPFPLSGTKNTPPGGMFNQISRLTDNFYYLSRIQTFELLTTPSPDYSLIFPKLLIQQPEFGDFSSILFSPFDFPKIKLRRKK